MVSMLTNPLGKSNLWLFFLTHADERRDKQVLNLEQRQTVIITCGKKTQAFIVLYSYNSISSPSLLLL